MISKRLRAPDKESALLVCRPVDLDVPEFVRDRRCVGGIDRALRVSGLGGRGGGDLAFEGHFVLLEFALHDMYTFIYI